MTAIRLVCVVVGDVCIGGGRRGVISVDRGFFNRVMSVEIALEELVLVEVVTGRSR